MDVIREVTRAHELEPWAGAKVTWEKIVKEGKVNEFFALIEELYPAGIREVELNDILWFDSDWLYESLGVK